jgi:hypothetical protein
MLRRGANHRSVRSLKRWCWFLADSRWRSSPFQRGGGPRSITGLQHRLSSAHGRDARRSVEVHASLRRCAPRKTPKRNDTGLRLGWSEGYNGRWSLPSPWGYWSVQSCSPRRHRCGLRPAVPADAAKVRRRLRTETDRDRLFPAHAMAHHRAATGTMPATLGSPPRLLRPTRAQGRRRHLVRPTARRTSRAWNPPGSVAGIPVTTERRDAIRAARAERSINNEPTSPLPRVSPPRHICPLHTSLVIRSFEQREWLVSSKPTGRKARPSIENAPPHHRARGSDRARSMQR